jgi:hypothetical protein
LEASKRSLFAQRSRFERALGALGEDELATTPEEDIADVNEPETSVNADSSRLFIFQETPAFTFVVEECVHCTRGGKNHA